MSSNEDDLCRYHTTQDFQQYLQQQEAILQQNQFSQQQLHDFLLNKSDAEVNQVSVKLPEFNPIDPELWFGVVERTFISARITSDASKFGYVVGALGPKFQREVRDIILSPPTTDMYLKLKYELLKRIGASQEEKMRRLLEREDMGDRKPSQFLRYLRELAGAAVPDGRFELFG